MKSSLACGMPRGRVGAGVEARLPQEPLVQLLTAPAPATPQLTPQTSAVRLHLPSPAGTRHGGGPWFARVHCCTKGRGLICPRTSCPQSRAPPPSSPPPHSVPTAMGGRLSGSAGQRTLAPHSGSSGADTRALDSVVLYPLSNPSRGQQEAEPRLGPGPGHREMKGHARMATQPPAASE